jgi:hypothetical protein
MAFAPAILHDFAHAAAGVGEIFGELGNIIGFALANATDLAGGLRLALQDAAFYGMEAWAKMRDVMEADIMKLTQPWADKGLIDLAEQGREKADIDEIEKARKDFEAAIKAQPKNGATLKQQLDTLEASLTGRLNDMTNPSDSASRIYGTFSATASSQLGGGNGPAEQTAKNTTEILQYIKNIPRIPGLQQALNFLVFS